MESYFGETKKYPDTMSYGSQSKIRKSKGEMGKPATLKNRACPSRLVLKGVLPPITYRNRPHAPKNFWHATYRSVTLWFFFFKVPFLYQRNSMVLLKFCYNIVLTIQAIFKMF